MVDSNQKLYLLVSPATKVKAGLLYQIHVLTRSKNIILMKQNEATSKPLLSMPVFIGNLPLESSLAHFNQLPHGEIFSGNVLPIPEQYQDYARAERSIDAVEGSKFVPSYITYMTERAMENIELLGN